MFAKIAILLAAVAVACAGLLPVAPALSHAYVPAATVVRTPSLDSAIIRSERLGGNFAYSSVEGHAYGVSTPIVQNVVSPVAVSYSARPIVSSYPGLIIH